MDFSREAEKYREEFLRLLTEWISIESVFDEKSIEKSMPFGKGVNEALKWFIDLGNKNGFITKNVDGYAAHIEYGQGDEYVYAFGHCDVVPAVEGWKQDPYKLLKLGDKLIGRGVTDDKGPVLAAYLALKLLKENNLLPKRRIRVAAGGNEESGFRCIKHYFIKEPKPKYGFTPDAKFPVINGEMGAMVIKICGDIENKSLSVKGGQVHNTIPNFITIKGISIDKNIESLFQKEKTEIQYINKENIKDGFKLIGMGGHSSKPEKANNPIEKGFKLFNELLKENWAMELNSLFGGSNLHCELLGLNVKGKCGNLKIVPTIIDIEKGRLQLTLSVRYPEVLENHEIADKIKKYCNEHKMNNYDISCSGIKEPSYVDENSPLVKTLYNIYVKHTGDTVNKVRTTSAGTYAALMQNSVVFGGEFPDGSSGNVHMTEEYGSLDAFIKSIGIYAEAFYELSRL
jgi:succinyl-diaminopimelate desuccinylase